MAYGYDTHSWRNSTEHRQMQQECAAATARYLASPRETLEVYPLCNCDDVPYPHDPEFWHASKWLKVTTRRRACPEPAEEPALSPPKGTP